MTFGSVPVTAAVGAVLAHSVVANATTLKKGRVLTGADIDLLSAAGIATVTVARLDTDDVGEDVAAMRLANALLTGEGAHSLAVSSAFTGRANLISEHAGLFRVDAAGIDAVNGLDPAITVATLADRVRVQAGQMVATVKMIPYGVKAGMLEQACDLASLAHLRVQQFVLRSATLVQTRTSGFRESLLVKGLDRVERRLASLGICLADSVVVDHDETEVARAISAATGEMILILGASATSDRRDTCPAGLVAAGGTLIRFGMPVDPGNLLFLGDLRGRPVVGLPGCARSPVPNGVDWVLDRLAAGEHVTSADIAGMGVGGLLKEVPQRPQPRAGRLARQGDPQVAVIVLAGGQSRRMRGRDKLLEPVDGKPVLRHVVGTAVASPARWVSIVLPPGKQEREAVLSGCDARMIVSEEAREGMAGSIRAGIASVPPSADAVILMLADMPEIGSGDLERLIAAFDPRLGHEICRATSEDGKPGHPVLFGRRFLESLLELRGDHGAREILQQNPEFVIDIPLPGRSALVDLDSPEAWMEWRSGQSDQR